MEYIFKSVGQGTGISCKPPNEYSNRFINFLESILNTDNDNKHSYNHKKKNNNNE